MSDAKNYNKRIHAKIDKQFLMKDNNWKLDPEALYIFTALALCERKDNISRVNYHIIDSILPEKFRKERIANNEKIAQILKKLINDKYITISHIPDKKEYYEFFYTEILYENWEATPKKDGKWLGYEPIYWEEFIGTKKIKYFYIYCIVKTNEGTGKGFKCSFELWHDITGFSISSMKRYIREMVHEDNKMLFVNRGDFLNGTKKKQEVNIYRTYEFKEEEQSNRTKNYKLKNKNKKTKRKPAFGTYTKPSEGELPF